ncbi:MAG: polynucleotide adenylyltransferase, partial [Clostridia bacterium]|nr:polynucleotide adenylyltransferase [Clostridia bacterium]
MITDNDILTILNMLTSAGYKAYAVGGYVRNSLMGIESTDCDITTSAAPNEIIEVFSNHKVIKTGIKHGTVTVVYNNIPYEITTFRTESEYTDFRHPNKVEFVNDVYLDLSRRDFTVNAIAYNPTQGVVDPFNGIDDIKNNILRTVGDPKERFNEDALRILRALRFASVLGFTIHNNTAVAINEMATTVANISAERIYTELKKLILGKHAVNVITQFKTAINKIIPIENIPENFDLLPLDISMRFAALCGSSVLQALNRLKADNNTIEKCALLLSSKPIPNDIIAIKQYISALGRENAAYVANYRRIIFGEDK